MPYVQPPTIYYPDLQEQKKSYDQLQILAAILRMKIRASDRSVTEWPERF